MKYIDPADLCFQSWNPVLLFCLHGADDTPGNLVYGHALYGDTRCNIKRYVWSGIFLFPYPVENDRRNSPVKGHDWPEYPVGHVLPDDSYCRWSVHPHGDGRDI